MYRRDPGFAHPPAAGAAGRGRGNRQIAAGELDRAVGEKSRLSCTVAGERAGSKVPQVCSFDLGSPLPNDKTSSSSQSRVLCRPVLEPSVFLLDNFIPSEWITIQRQKRRIAHRCSNIPLRSMRTHANHIKQKLSSVRRSVRNFQIEDNKCIKF
jgi:hypothetical protein